MTPDRWRELEELYQAARDVPAAERSALLERADPELRAPVAVMLEASTAGKEGDATFLEVPAWAGRESLLGTETLVTIGEQLGSYRIEEVIGVGGMGKVFRALDTRLNRTVAIKTSFVPFSHYFEREARVIASLNHPHIATLYDVGSSASGLGYLVLEYVEGCTLADLIRRGPIGPAEVRRIALETAEAVEAAHERGIVHRDLKPANIKLGKDGAVKVLDFGLAKAMDEPAGEITKQGSIFGTPSYMSPEQALGGPVDRRSDIWSFGVLVSEMLTGKRLFSGTTSSGILAHVLRAEPDLTGVPPEWTPLLSRCVTRDVRRRLQSIGEARIMLEDGLTAHEAGRNVSAVGRAPWIATAALAVVAGALGWGLYQATRPVPLKPLVRLDADLGAVTSLGAANGADTILSPDGTRLVYVSEGKLFTRRMEQSRAIELEGTEGAFAPFFSPDSKWVAFFTPGKLKKIFAEGGTAVALCDASSTGSGGSWGEDGNIIAGLGVTEGLSRVPSSGGIPAPVTQLNQGEATHRWPQILPGGRAVLFTSNTSVTAFDGASIEIVSLADHRRKTLQHGGTFGRYLPGPGGSGHLIYMNRGKLFAVPFDPVRLEVHGTPAPVVDEVAYSADGSAQFDFSRRGTLVYRGGGAEGAGLATVQWLNAGGKGKMLLAKPGFYLRPRLSPDGQRLALDDGSSIWVYDARRDTMMRLTTGGGASFFPVWSPDGRYIAFGKTGGEGAEGIWWVRSDGDGKPQKLVGARDAMPYSFTPDGKRLGYFEGNASTSFDIVTVPVESDAAGLRAGTPEVFLQTPASERAPAFSPDGHWLAYESNESGTYQVYVKSFPDRGGKWQISNAGGSHPFWSAKTHELFFRAAGSRIMAARYALKSDVFVADKPRLWSARELAHFGGVGIATYDLAPDGQHIVALMPAGTAKPVQPRSRITFLENFADELQRAVPAGK